MINCWCKCINFPARTCAWRVYQSFINKSGGFTCELFWAGGDGDTVMVMVMTMVQALPSSSWSFLQSWWPAGHCQSSIGRQWANIEIGRHDHICMMNPLPPWKILWSRMWEFQPWVAAGAAVILVAAMLFGGCSSCTGWHMARPEGGGHPEAGLSQQILNLGTVECTEWLKIYM